MIKTAALEIEKNVLAGDNIVRYPENPLLVPADIRPSYPGLKVDGVFNCGVVEYKNEIILLCRVAESFENSSDEFISFPVMRNNRFIMNTLEKAKYPWLDFSDPRVIKNSGGDIINLTSMSYLLAARSNDGVNFTLDYDCVITPQTDYEAWGIEDPRITLIGDTYYINYTAVSSTGAATALITTKDFKAFERQGIIFLPENKDVVIFPEKINGRYIAFNRPSPASIGSPDIWISQSDDLRFWGEHKHFYGVNGTGWESGRIGGGAPPVRTDKGWVKIYHAADKNNRYCLGAFLLDINDPCVIIAKSQKPLLEPEKEYETRGFFGNVVFTCGAILKDENLAVYYGAADDKICRGDITLTGLFNHLGVL